MACHRTKPAWKTRDGITLRMPPGKPKPDYYIPCNKCLGCKADHARDWAIRIEHEARMHEQKCFITLTYADEHLPRDGKISRPALTEILRQFRERLDIPIRYFGVGEYGEKTKRPHYHAVIFGSDFLGGSEETRQGKYIHPILTALWPYGMHEIQPYDDGTAVYTAGYVTKKIGNPDCFSIKSTRPPLGREYCLKNYERIISQGTAVINGTELPIPKVYIQWLEHAGHNVQPLKDKIREVTRKKPVITDSKGRSRDINKKADLQRRGERI